MYRLKLFAPVKNIKCKNIEQKSQICTEINIWLTINYCEPEIDQLCRTIISKRM